MEIESCVPPGFRFHPTEEELVGYYLARKVASQKIDIEVIVDIDLYRIEPWDLKDKCRHGHEDQNEWYFFSHKDKKYPTGTRTNRATAKGFWKATGRDKAVLSRSRVIGMRKTLVFYEGRAPNGRKSDWIMHEYRLQSSEHAPPQEEGWVVCRAFKKPSPSCQQRMQCYSGPWSAPAGAVSYHDHQHGRFFQATAPTYVHHQTSGAAANSYQTFADYHDQLFACDQEFESKQQQQQQQQPVAQGGLILKLPHLDSPCSASAGFVAAHDQELAPLEAGGSRRAQQQQHQHMVDWKALDRLLGCQMNDSTSSSNSNLPLINLDYDADAHDQDQHLLLASFNPNM